MFRKQIIKLVSFKDRDYLSVNPDTVSYLDWILWNVSHHDVILCPEVLRHSSLVSSSLGSSERHICPVRLSVLPVEIAHESSGALRVRKRAAVHHHLPGARDEEGSREAHETI